MQSLKNFKRVVLKIGSSLLFKKTAAGGICLDSEVLSQLVEQISYLTKSGKEALVVSSGAIASGLSLLKLAHKPKDLSLLQAIAAIGQPELMDVYRNAFRQRGLNCSQVLLTAEDLASRKRYLNAKNTLLTLLKLKNIPVINENDTVSTEEIKFGDNDRLSALVASLVKADILVILSDVDGLLDREKKVIRIVDEITPRIKALACPSDKKTCVGGMITKLEAAKISVDSGIPCVVANGRTFDIIPSLLKDPASHGTIFLPKKALTAKKHWIAFGSRPKGRVIVDDGAREALMNKKSLLSVGVIFCEGNFQAGDIVSIRDKENNEFARGISGLSFSSLDKAKGKRTDKEVVHRDNIVIL
ncbi:MAG: glutamate 5-kinase [Candidatus Omnitrophota bacterium]